MFKICEWLKKKGFNTAFIDESGAIKVDLQDKGWKSYSDWGTEMYDYLTMEINETFPKMEVGSNVRATGVLFFKVE